MASKRTRLLRHQTDPDPRMLKVLSAQERERIRACLPVRVSLGAAEVAYKELERAFAIYRSGLANKAAKRPEKLNSELTEIELAIKDLLKKIDQSTNANCRRIMRHLSGDRAQENAAELGHEQFDAICGRFRGAVRYARSRIRDDDPSSGRKGDTGWLYAELARIWEEATGLRYSWSKNKYADIERYPTTFFIEAIKVGGAEKEFLAEYMGKEKTLGAILNKYHDKNGSCFPSEYSRSSEESDRSDDDALGWRKR
jgi:hypothetical protein